MHVLEVRSAELIRSLTEQAAANGITDAAIVGLIGAVDGFTVSTTPAEDPTSHNISQYPLPAEMIAGHLIKAQLGTSFARAFVIPTDQPIALLANEDVVVEEFPDAGPPGRGRINDTRSPLR